MSDRELNEQPRQTEDETIAERTYERTKESCRITEQVERVLL